MATEHRKTGEIENIQARREQVLALRRQGKTLSQIVEKVGASRATVARDIQHALKELADETQANAEVLRQRELLLMDTLEDTLLPRAIGTVDEKGNVTEPGDLRAVDRLIRISERRSKLLGLDKAGPTDADLWAQIQSLLSAQDIEERAFLRTMLLKMMAAQRAKKNPLIVDGMALPAGDNDNDMPSDGSTPSDTADNTAYRK